MEGRDWWHSAAAVVPLEFNLSPSKSCVIVIPHPIIPIPYTHHCGFSLGPPVEKVVHYFGCKLEQCGAKPHFEKKREVCISSAVKCQHRSPSLVSTSALQRITAV